MTIRKFLELSVEPSFQEFKIWDIGKGEYIFEGTSDDCFNLDDEIGSIDLIDATSPILVFNIEIEEY